MPDNAGIWHTLASIQLKAHGRKAAFAAMKTWIDSPGAASLAEKDIADTFRMAIEKGMSKDLCGLLTSSRSPDEWSAWVSAISAVESSEHELQPQADRLLQILKTRPPP
jgi:hypothetical protein